MSTYQTNQLNQYTQRTVPGAIDVFGLADPQTTVQVNGATASRYGSYFHKVVSVDNSTSAQYPTITIQAGNNSVTRHAFVPKNPEIFSYDKDGNLTQDGRWNYEWNGENRLIRMTTRSDVPGPHYQLTFQYDWMGRRIRKTVVNLDTGQTISDLIFLYDGWNLIAEVDAQTGELIRTYVWGLDLSGTMQGAGGIGGLLWVNVESGSHVGRYFAAYDGNGNVMGLVFASDGSVVAQYGYGPFAEPLRATGPLAADNPLRFSTKYTDPETGLLYYGYRYYNPSLGRWLRRDPSMFYREFMKEFLFVGNDPVDQLDFLGLYDFQFIGSGWTAERKQYVENIQKELIEELQDVLKKIEEWKRKALCLSPKCSYRKPLLKALAKVKKVVEKTKKALESKKQIKAEIALLDRGVVAEFRYNTTLFHTFKFNQRFAFDESFFTTDKQEAIKTFFHEVTHHAANTEDSGPPWENAHDLGYLLDNGFANWLRNYLINKYGRNNCPCEGDTNVELIKQWPNNKCSKK